MYKSVTLLFPGQGSQYVGMGSELRHHASFRFIEAADEQLPYSLTSIMLDGPPEQLQQTQNTQPAIVAHSYALFHQLSQLLSMRQVEVSRVLGHSVGEYSALAAAGAMDLADAIKAVHLRGRLMQEAVALGSGKMYAILKVPLEKIEKACEESSSPASKVMIANYNSPEQVVISGDTKACERAIIWLDKNVIEKYRAVELKVSAPFHCHLMRGAAAKMEVALEHIPVKQTTMPYIANVNAKEYPIGINPKNIKENLVSQIESPVLWTKSMELIPDDTLCLEVGPGKVLTGLAKKINPNLKVIAMDTPTAMEELGDLVT
jgi:[acyl-carrier-protein] S-malonyltransferase